MNRSFQKNIFLLIAINILIRWTNGYEMDGDIFVLKSSDFDNAIKQYNQLFVMFCKLEITC